jgi:hypothetical protein
MNEVAAILFQTSDLLLVRCGKQGQDRRFAHDYPKGLLTPRGTTTYTDTGIKPK